MNQAFVEPLEFTDADQAEMDRANQDTREEWKRWRRFAIALPCAVVLGSAMWITIALLAFGKALQWVRGIHF